MAGRQKHRTIAAAFALLVSCSSLATAGATLSPEIWFAPPDNVMQPNKDFPRLFEQPASWTDAAKNIRGISITGNWLVGSPEGIVAEATTLLRRANIKMLVSIPALPVDKTKCGDGIEGMIWPGEAKSYASRLKGRNVDVFAFSLDLPLTNGHIMTKGAACRLPIAEVARLTAISVRELRAAYPDAKIIDDEVPTGIPLDVWLTTLDEWLAAYRVATGTELDGLTMDAWWESAWKDTVARTIQKLHQRGIKAGLYIDADGNRSMAAETWIEQAKQNACAVAAMRLPLDRVIIANWSSATLRTVPADDPATLAGLVKWYGAGPNCSN